MEKVDGEMRWLEGDVQWLRTFVEKHGWDYCVVWKLNDDPSRFVEFVDCCCAGGYVSEIVKVERNGDQSGVMGPCRDVHQEHPIQTKACETLAQIPETMPLYSGIHTDVAMNNQPMWLSEYNATLVLIPIEGGMIELFADKLVDKDQRTVDFIQSQYNASMTCGSKENYLNPIAAEFPPETQLGQCLQNSSPGVLFIDDDTISSPKLEPVIRGTRPHTIATLPGSSTGSTSNPSNSLPNSASGPLSLVGSLPSSLKNSPCSKKPKFSEYGNSLKSQTGTAFAWTNAASEHAKYPKLKEGSKAKNLEVERKRRSRIKDGEFQLRALVPKISKMDRASIISDAIEYIIELKKKVKELEEEFKNDEQSEVADQGNKFSGKKTTEFEYKNSEVQVKVHEICERKFLIRIEADQQPGDFSRLMEVLSSMVLQIEEINIRSCHGLVLSSLLVEADSEVQQHQLREALIKGLHGTA